MIRRRHRSRLFPFTARSGSELASVIRSPAIRGAGGRDRTGVVAAGAHRSKAHVADHEHRARPRSRGLVTKLAARVVTPAVGAARGREPAGVVAADAHGGEPHPVTFGPY